MVNKKYINKIKKYTSWIKERICHNFMQLLISIDQFIFSIIGFILFIKVFADETFSSFCYRKREKNKLVWICYKFVNFLFFWQEDHCRDSWISEKKRNHSPRRKKEDS